jgi:septin family protein
LVIGEQNSGKTSFIEFLRNALSDKKQKREKTPSPPQTGVTSDAAFTPYYLETDIDHERIGVTLWDSQGLEKKFVDLQLREMSSFLESKFEETFTEEQKVVRAPGVRDTHIHCVFLILDPTRLNANLVSTRKAKQASTLDEPARLIGALDEDLDIQVLKTLQGKTTVIPVISKADTITTTHMALLKKSVWNSLRQAKIDPLDVLNVGEESEDEGSFDEREEDAYLGATTGPLENNGPDVLDNFDEHGSSSDYEEGDENGHHHTSSPPTSPPRSNNKDAVKAHRRSMSDALDAAPGTTEEIPFLPMSIISPDSYEPGIVGRRFPWGFADPYNTEHCDFVRLKDAVFSEWRAELREASREVWYEGWRTSRLRRRDRAPSVGKTQWRKTAQANAGPEGVRSPGAYRQGVAF